MAVFMKARWLRLLALATLLCFGPVSSALAAMVINAITYGPVATATSTLNVAPGASFQVNLTVTLTGGTRWRSTTFTTTPTSSLSVCSFAPDLSISKTYVVSFTLTAPTAANLFSLNATAYSNPNCNGGSSSKTNPSSLNTAPVVVSLNHVRIIHDGTGLTCAPEAITLKACADAACSTLFTANTLVTLGAAGTWSAANPVLITNGSRSLTLSNATAGTVTLSGTVNSPSSTSPALSCYNGNAASCSLTFSNSSCSLDSVEVGKAPNTPIFTKLMGGNVTLDVLSLNSGVINTSSTVAVTAKLVQGTATGCGATALSNPVSFNFTGANAGRKPITFTPTAASRNARVLLTSGSLIACSSDNFAIRPSAFSVLATGVGADPAGASVSALPALKAGTTSFNLSLTSASGYDGVPVIDANLVNSSSVNDGALSGTFGTAGAANSYTNAGAFTYSEVGYFRFGAYALYDDTFADIDAAKLPAECVASTSLGTGTLPPDPNVVAADGRIGCYFGNAQTSYFGRFVPDHFAVTASSIVNRSATTACAASSFTYLGETMTPTFTLQAQNGANELTANYSGTFARINPVTDVGFSLINAPSIGARTPIPLCGATPVQPCYISSAVTGSFVTGELTDGTAPLAVFRGSTAAAPFPDLKVGLAPVDPDLVKLVYDFDTVNATAGANNHTLAGSTIARYGRLYIENAYGSELLNLTLKVKAQYYNGAQWVTNVLDSCTPQSYLDFAALNDYRNLNAVNMPFSKLSAPLALASGTGSFLLAKPSGSLTSQGSVNIKSGYPAYLPGNGRATFGVYKSGPVIYVRETY